METALGHGPRQEPHSEDPIRMSEPRLFRRLLRLLPFDFRADYGREMEQVFREQHREADGPWARTGVWMRASPAPVRDRPARTRCAAAAGSAVRRPRYGPQSRLRRGRRVALALGIGANTAISASSTPCCCGRCPTPIPIASSRSPTAGTAARPRACPIPNTSTMPSGADDEAGGRVDELGQYHRGCGGVRACGDGRRHAGLFFRGRRPPGHRRGRSSPATPLADHDRVVVLTRRDLASPLQRRSVDGRPRRSSSAAVGAK